MSPDDIDQEIDLLQRYESILQTQVETINGIDDKAIQTARLIGVLGGLVMTGTSLAVSTGVLEVSTETAIGIIALGAGSVALFVSLVFAIITYLSTRFEYGPTSQLGYEMAQYQIKEQDYRDMMLRGYSTAIQKNRKVVDANSDRFKHCLASLSVAIIFLFAAGPALLSPLYSVDLVICGLAIVLAAVVGYYILQEHYITIERE